VIPPRFALPLVENEGTPSRFRIEVAQNFHAMTSRTNRALHDELASNGSKSKIFIDRPSVRPRGQPVAVAATKADIFVLGREPEWPVDVNLSLAVNHFSIVVLYFSPSTVEEADVRRCRKNGSPQAVA
jgi:hypothetical protein